MDPVSPPEDLQNPTLAQLLTVALDSRLEDVHTCSWGSVISYDSATQRASIQLIPRRSFVDEDGQRQTERPAPLLDVPVKFPGSGDYSITFPVKAGDTVLVLFAESPMDAWKAKDVTDSDTGDDRRHSLSDPIAIPGLRSKRISGPPPGDSLCVTAPKILLGSKDASKGAARTGDSVHFTASAQTTLDARYVLAGTPSELTGSEAGTIAGGSAKVKVDD